MDIQTIITDTATVNGITYWRVWWIEKSSLEAMETNVGTSWHAVYPPVQRYRQTLSWYNVATYPTLASAVDAWVASR